MRGVAWFRTVNWQRPYLRALLKTKNRRMTRLAADLVESFEPDPLNDEALRRSLPEAIREGRLTVIEKALWDPEGTLTPERHDTSTRTTVGLQPASKQGIEVPMTTLDRRVQGLNLSCMDFITMDIEGAEQPALRGAVATLKRHRPILAIGAYHKPDDVDEIPRIVQGAEPSYTITPLRCLMLSGRVIPFLFYFHIAGSR